MVSHVCWCAGKPAIKLKSENAKADPPVGKHGTCSISSVQQSTTVPAKDRENLATVVPQNFLTG